MELLEKKQSLERLCRDRRYAEMEEGREKFAALGDVTRTAGSDLKLQKWRRNSCLLK